MPKLLFSIFTEQLCWFVFITQWNLRHYFKLLDLDLTTREFSFLLMQEQMIRACKWWGNLSCTVDIETIIDLTLRLFFSCLVPKFIEKLVIIFLSRVCLYDCIQIFFWDDPWDLLIFIFHFNIDELLPRLHCPIKLEVEAPAHKYHKYDDDMNHICPTYALHYVKILTVIRYLTKRKPATFFIF